MDKFYHKLAEESQPLIETTKANPSNDSSHWIISLFDLFGPIPFQAALLSQLEEQDRIDGLEASTALRDQFIQYFQDKTSFDTKTIYFNQLEKYKQDRCWHDGKRFVLGSSVYIADCKEHTMCELHKDRKCTRHESVEEAAQGDSKDKAMAHRDHSSGDGTQKDEIDHGNKESHAQSERLKIEDIKNFSESDFVFERRPKEEICKVELADRRELWFHQTEYLERQAMYYAKKGREDESSDDDIVNKAEGSFRHLNIGA